jgi:hypothetical protein
MHTHKQQETITKKKNIKKKTWNNNKAKEKTNKMMLRKTYNIKWTLHSKIKFILNDNKKINELKINN